MHMWEYYYCSSTVIVPAFGIVYLYTMNCYYCSNGVPQAIAIGRLKSTSSEDDIDNKDDMCEMAAHYKVKYGLQGLEKTLSLASKRFSRSIDSEEVPSNLDMKLTSSLPNLIDSSDGSKNSDDIGDDLPYMVMQPHKKSVQHSMSLDRLSSGTTPFHKPVASSMSSGGAFTYSDSPPNNHGSIRVANGYLTSPTRPHPTIPENTPDDFSGE